MAEVYQPLMLATPSMLVPVRRALEMTPLLPPEAQAAARSALQHKLDVLQLFLQQRLPS